MHGLRVPTSGGVMRCGCPVAVAVVIAGSAVADARRGRRALRHSAGEVHQRADRCRVGGRRAQAVGCGHRRRMVPAGASRPHRPDPDARRTPGVSRRQVAHEAGRPRRPAARRRLRRRVCPQLDRRLDDGAHRPRRRRTTTSTGRHAAVAAAGLLEERPLRPVHGGTGHRHGGEHQPQGRRWTSTAPPTSSAARWRRWASRTACRPRPRRPRSSSALQVQCTQCHNHPFNKGKQNQFWELNAFFPAGAVPSQRRYSCFTSRWDCQSLVGN